MALVIPTSFVSMMQALVLSHVSVPAVHKSVDEKFRLTLQVNRMVLRNDTEKGDFFAILKLDAITMDSLSRALLKCYVYDAEAEPHYRVKFEIRKLDPEDRMKTILDFEFWIGRDNNRAWLKIPVQGHGDVNFDLPEIN